MSAVKGYAAASIVGVLVQFVQPDTVEKLFDAIQHQSISVSLTIILALMLVGFTQASMIGPFWLIYALVARWRKITSPGYFIMLAMLAMLAGVILHSALAALPPHMMFDPADYPATYKGAFLWTLQRIWFSDLLRGGAAGFTYWWIAVRNRAAAPCEMQAL